MSEWAAREGSVIQRRRSLCVVCVMSDESQITDSGSEQ